MAAVAAEADGAPLWGQVVGQPEPSPLMDERVLRRLCGMLGVPAAGSLADQAAACRAALLGGEPEMVEEELDALALLEKQHAEHKAQAALIRAELGL